MDFIYESTGGTYRQGNGGLSSFPTAPRVEFERVRFSASRPHGSEHWYYTREECLALLRRWVAAGRPQTCTTAAGIGLVQFDCGPDDESAVAAWTADLPRRLAWEAEYDARMDAALGK